jgi:hypothetical protein
MIPLPKDLAAIAIGMTRPPASWWGGWRTATEREDTCGTTWRPHIYKATGEVVHLPNLCDSPRCRRCALRAITNTVTQFANETRTWSRVWVGRRAHASSRAVNDRVAQLRRRYGKGRSICYLAVRPSPGGDVGFADTEGPNTQSPRTPVWVLANTDLADGTDQDSSDAWHGG